jgi:spore coat protein CotH
MASDRGNKGILMKIVSSGWTLAVLLSCGAGGALAQPPGGGPPGFGGPPGGFGFGPGGPMGGAERKLVGEYDTDENGWLDQDERKAARESLANDAEDRPRGFGPPDGGRRGFGPTGGGRRGGGRRGGGGFFGRGNREPAQPGPRVSPEEVTNYPDAPLYEPTVLRTLFLDFENDDWEAELQDFKGTDVEVPATLTVDGKTYPHVGVHFRGASSYFMVQAGHKRSLNVSLDFVDEAQRLYGHKSLNLLNSNGDPSMMSTSIYAHIARQHIPTPRANFVKVVINGESWGVYGNVEQFDKVFTAENFGSSKGTRWKVKGSPGGDGGLRYLGDDLDEYQSRYEMKSNDGENAWQALVELCHTLNETPLEELEQELEPMLDIDGALWFLALDVALINSDGYWTRASDYNIFRDADGVFHILPHDMNEAFHEAGGGPGGFGGFGGRRGRGGFGEFGPPGADRPPRDGEDDRQPRDRGPGGGGGSGLELDPLVGIDDPRFALRNRLLAVPKLRAKYLGYVREIAETSLDWNHLGPVVAQYRELIEDEVEQDTRKLSSFGEFVAVTSPERRIGLQPSRNISFRDFADGRRDYLLDYMPPKE